MIRKNGSAILLLITIVVMISLDSCNLENKFDKEEAAQIQDYLTSNSNLNFELKPSGLYYLQVKEGTGRQAVTHDTAYVKYTGKFLDGTIFDDNTGTSDTLVRPVNEGWLIYGFDEGLTYMKEGGKAIFLVPSKLAYGDSGWFGIPGHTPLLYDVTLVLVKPGPGK